MSELTLPTSFNLIDAVLALIILLGIISGFSRGFVASTLQLLTLAASVALAFVGYHFLEDLLQANVPTLGIWTAPVSFLATYVLAHLLIGAVTSAITNGVPRVVHTNVLNRLLGVMPGFANGLVNAMLVSLLLLSVPFMDAVSTMARESQITTRLAAPAEWLEARLAPIFHPAINRTLQALTVPVESKSSVKLPYKVTDAKVRPDLEAEMLGMVNSERLLIGLQPLQADPELAEVARAHSRDMFARSYFSHVNLEGQEPFDRMRQARVRYLTAGENLALAQTLAGAHQGLMNSPGHRANILRAQYGRLGIGVLDGGRHGLMITQNFRN